MLVVARGAREAINITQVGFRVYTCLLAIPSSFPKGVLGIIKKLCFNFLWSGEGGKTSSHWASWRSITKPKSEDGLGLKDIRIFCKSLVGKNKDNLWNRLIVNKYLVSDTIISWTRREEESSKNISIH